MGLCIGVNVALRKPTNQSSTIRGGPATNANDGEKTTVHDGKRCTETMKESSPWWQVDLLKPYPIRAIRVTTRGCCGKCVLVYVYQCLLSLPIASLTKIKAPQPYVPSGNYKALVKCNISPRDVIYSRYFLKFFTRQVFVPTCSVPEENKEIKNKNSRDIYQRAHCLVKAYN
jgi:hypothetical protein